MIESQQTITDWADQTFGSAGSNARVAARANEEMAELLRALTADDKHPKAGEEVADVAIILYRLATRLGIDLHDEIDRKMAVNRGRHWQRDNTGHGYHVRVSSAQEFRCRQCGCTDSDCSGCIDRTGHPCYWVEEDLCSACGQTSTKQVTS